MQNKALSYLIPGIILTYFGLSHMNNFDILFDGLALLFGGFAIVLSIIEFTKRKNK